MTLRNAFEELALDSTAQALKELNDTMLYMLGAILEKMPRVTGNDQAAVSVEGGSVNIASGTVTTVGTVTNMANIGGRHTANLSDALTMSGTSHIYSNITVTP